MCKSLTILKEHNPFESRDRFGCRTRLVVNTYKGCSNHCQYCYIYSYIKLSDILNPKPKKDFEAKIERDIRKYRSSDLPKYPVYVSSSCDPFQPIENKHRHTLLALTRLAENEFPVIIMTKNPAKLSEPDYAKAICKSKTVIQVTIPFLNDRFEPYAPSPEQRIRAVKHLTKSGFQVVARVDPLVPSYGAIEGQSKEEINSLVSRLHASGVKCIVSKCLRLAPGIKKMYPRFYEQLRPFYQLNKAIKSNWELSPESKQRLLAPVYESCEKHGMKMATCVDSRHVSFPTRLRCDGFDEFQVAH